MNKNFILVNLVWLSLWPSYSKGAAAFISGEQFFSAFGNPKKSSTTYVFDKHGQRFEHADKKYLIKWLIKHNNSLSNKNVMFDRYGKKYTHADKEYLGQWLDWYNRTNGGTNKNGRPTTTLSPTKPLSHSQSK